MPGAEEAVIGEELLPGVAEELGLTSAAPAVAPAFAESAPVYDYGPPPTEGAPVYDYGPTATETIPPATDSSASDTLTKGLSSTAPSVYGDLGASTGASAGLPFTTGGATVSAPYQGAFDTAGLEGVSPSVLDTGSAEKEALFGSQGYGGAATESEKRLSEKLATASGGAYDPSKALEYLGLTKPGGGLGGNALPAAALGLSQYRANKMGQSLQDQLKAASAQVQPVASSLINQYETGQINPAQEKQITDLTNNTKARIKQRYAQMGRDPNTDSAAQSELAKADADAVAMRDAAQQGILTQGLKAAGLAQGPATSAVMAGYQSDLQQQQAMQSFLNTLALMQSKQATT